MDKTYMVTYKNGNIQKVTGKIVLFTTTDITMTELDLEAIYLNANEVVSIVDESSLGDSRSGKEV